MEKKVLAKIVIDWHGGLDLCFGEKSAVVPSKKFIEELMMELDRTSEGKAIKKEIEAANNFDGIMEDRK